MTLTKQNTMAALLLSAETFGVVETLHRFYGENIKVRICYSKSACEQDVDDLQLSVRSHNALKRASLFTVESVIDAIADGTMEKIRNLGRKSVSEIKSVLLQVGYDKLSEREKEQFFVYVMENNELCPAVLVKPNAG